jgi:hypothetical protein
LFNFVPEHILNNVVLPCSVAVKSLFFIPVPVLYEVCSESNAPGAAVYISPKGGGGLVFTADSSDPLLVIHEIALGQQEVCRFRLCLSETGTDPP